MFGGGVEAVGGVWGEEGEGEGGRMAGGVEEGWENEGGVEFEGLGYLSTLRKVLQCAVSVTTASDLQ